MDTAVLVARAAGGDLDSFGQLYDAHFNRVYDFAWRLLRDADAAAAVTRRVFDQVVHALPRISAQGDFASSLLLAAARDAIAHTDAAAKRGPRALHEEAFGAFDAPDPCRLRDPGLTGGDHELACLVWDAATTLSARDYAALDLHARQGLEAAALAPLLGVARGSAAPMLERLQRAADDAMRTYVLARRGGKDCEPLRHLLVEAGFPPYTDAVQTAVDAHAAACATCRENRALPAAPSAILRGFLPVQAPFVLKGDAWRALVAMWPAAAAAGAAPALMARALESEAVPDAAHQFSGALAPGRGSDGGGRDGDLPWLGAGEDDARRNILWFAAAAVGMLAVAFLVGGIAVGAFGIGIGGGGGAAATPTSTPSPIFTPPVTPSPGVVIDTPTPAPTPSPAPPPTQTPPPPPPATATPPPRPTVPPATPTRIGSPTPTPGQPTPGGPPTPTPTPTP
ncbi:MAG: RNA polymerase sigma factor [Dehalococcoidia bacterium]